MDDGKDQNKLLQINEKIYFKEKIWNPLLCRSDQKKSMTHECSTWVARFPGVVTLSKKCLNDFQRGNKWAATKWVYSDPQMWTQPCQVERPHNYPPFGNPVL